ncbi:MAG: CoA ester lyase [Acidimicrobiia bacterium]|nr:CoA ester lyase [Acidimicrobiia bacterium]MDH5521766.1 CoA ester lyase [Acidimicrobiia bacterium]
MSEPERLNRLRSVLIAPAVRPDFIAKLPSRGADVLFLDCEDAVPANAKAEARTVVTEWAPRLVEGGSTVVVRVNPVSSEWFADDIRNGLPHDVSAVVIPKIERLSDLDEAAAALDEVGLSRLGVFAGIETALGVADARLVLAHPRVVAAYFGAEDFVADMGGVRTEGNAEVAYARAQVALAGRLASVPLVDQVVTNFSDDARYRREATEARNLGYDGKLCIHPAQVPPANEAFTPSADEIDRARRLLAAYEASSAAGIAAIDFEGQMVDEPLAVQARRLLERVATDATAADAATGKARSTENTAR